MEPPASRTQAQGRRLQTAAAAQLRETGSVDTGRAGSQGRGGNVIGSWGETWGSHRPRESARGRRILQSNPGSTASLSALGSIVKWARGRPPSRRRTVCEWRLWAPRWRRLRLRQQGPNPRATHR
jgi:hypothetical protein